MRALVALALMASCDRRTVSITTAEPALEIRVQTEDDTNAKDVSVHVTTIGRGVVPLLIIPVPVPFARGACLAEKP